MGFSFRYPFVTSLFNFRRSFSHFVITVGERYSFDRLCYRSLEEATRFELFNATEEGICPWKYEEQS